MIQFSNSFCLGGEGPKVFPGILIELLALAMRNWELEDVAVDYFRTTDLDCTDDEVRRRNCRDGGMIFS